MKRITFEVDDFFAENFSKYCIENDKSKKSVITDLILKKMNDNGVMEQYENLHNDFFRNNIMNEKNYKKLYSLDIEDEEFWTLRNNLSVNSNINNYFRQDKTLKSFIDYLDRKKIKDTSIPNALLDHDYYVKFSDKNTEYEFSYLYGVMTFPYMNFDKLKNIIYSWNTNFWNIYIINPTLMKYANGSLGLFITPVDEFAIEQCNGFFETLTGYKLFYLWTNSEELKPIMKKNIVPDDSEWIKMLTDDEFPIMSQKIIKFWLNNDDINCYSLKNSYFAFIHNMPFIIPTVMLTTIEGKDFEMVDTVNGWTTGKCNTLEFDLKSFKCIYVNEKIIEFNEEMIQSLKEGNFELKKI